MGENQTECALSELFWYAIIGYVDREDIYSYKFIVIFGLLSSD